MISFHCDAMPICGLREVLIAHADRAQHPAGGGALDAVGDVAAARLQICHALHPPDLGSKFR